MGQSLAQLETLRRELSALVFRCREPARSMAEAERRIAEGERIAKALRAAFRGSG